MKKCAFLLVAFVAFTLNSHLQAQPLVTIDTVTVGDAGNAPDTNGRGSVFDVFAIGKYEVTIGQYTTFLNSVAAVTSNSYLVNLWNPNMAANLNIAGINRIGVGIVGDAYNYSVIGSSNRPVSYVSWFDAARFANWINNGALTNSSTETGAYSLNFQTNGIVHKNANAKWWIPDEDQWYKAAYYKSGGTNAGYWLYPTESDTAPGNQVGSSPNQANMVNNFGDYSVTQSWTYSPTQNYLTDAGAFSNSASPYDTFDQGGNLSEWTDGFVGSSNRAVRGGAWGLNDFTLESSTRSGSVTSYEDDWTGFRVATVPEPSTYGLLLMGAGALYFWKRRRVTL